MAVYKVPQDVEAEDKLLGPFSFRQFIYLLVAALGIFIAYVLSRIFIGLFVIPLPFVIALLALALPLKKDQPMETYLIAMIKFFFKPRHRLWDPEGTISLLQITAPKVNEGPALKDFTGDEAAQRLEYLAQIVDSRGWSTRGATSGTAGMDSVFIADANKMEDIMDSGSSIAATFDQRIAVSDDALMQAARNEMQTAISAPRPPSPIESVKTTPVQPAPRKATTPQRDVLAKSPTEHSKKPAAHTTGPRHKIKDEDGAVAIEHTQYKESANALNTGLKMASETTETRTGGSEVSPDIIRLANNNDLSISTIAREAHRLSDEPNQEVVISLR